MYLPPCLAAAAVLGQDEKFHTDYAADLKVAEASAHFITQRSQPSGPAFLRIGISVKFRGSRSVLNQYLKNGRLKYTLYLLAVSQTIRSELGFKVSQMLAHDGHAYQLE